MRRAGAVVEPGQAVAQSFQREGALLHLLHGPDVLGRQRGQRLAGLQQHDAVKVQRLPVGAVQLGPGAHLDDAGRVDFGGEDVLAQVNHYLLIGNGFQHERWPGPVGDAGGIGD
jgi:hypothetical protein